MGIQALPVRIRLAPELWEEVRFGVGLRLGEGEEAVSDYDSTADTLTHIRRVNTLLQVAAAELLVRASRHDQTKLEEPEKPVFDEFTPKLKETTYGSEEYRQNLEAMGPALEHHFAHNSHHPEHYDAGIEGMDLFDVLEMLIDWKAASERMKDRDHEGLNKGKLDLEFNRERFGISDQLMAILENTVARFF